VEEEWWVCAEGWVNVMLEMPSLGIGLHGHDVVVEYCGSWRREGLLVYDMDKIRSTLRSILEGLDRRRLAKALGGGEAALEDLARHVCIEVTGKLEPRPLKAVVKAWIPGGSIRYACTWGQPAQALKP